MSFIIENDLSGLVHLRWPSETETVSNFGGITFAYRIEAEKDDDGNAMTDLSNIHLSWASAVCSNRDNFSREFGRDLAVSRLNEKGSLYGTIPLKSLMTTANEEHVENILSSFREVAETETHIIYQSHENISGFNSFIVYMFMPSLFGFDKTHQVIRFKKNHIVVPMFEE